MQADSRPIAAQCLILALIFCTLLLGGCATGYWASAPDSPDNNFYKNQKLTLPLKVSWIKPLINYGQDVPFRPLEYASPIIGESHVYVGVSTGHFFALNKITGSIQWRFDAYGPVDGAPAIAGNIIVFGDSDGMVYGLDRRTGFAKWTYKPLGEILGRPLIENGKVYFSTSYNRVYCLDMNDGKWVWMHQRDIPGTFTVKGVAGIVIDKELLFAGFSDGYIVALDPASGREKWKNLLNIGEQLTDVDSTPTVGGDFVYVAAYDGNLYGLGRNDGEVRWKLEGGESVSKAALKGDVLYVSTSMGDVIAVDKFSGRKIWEMDIRQEDRSHSLAKGPIRRRKNANSPVIIKDTLITASNHGYLYALDIENGDVKWRWYPGIGVSGNFAVDSGRIYFLGNAGQLFSFLLESPIFESISIN